MKTVGRQDALLNALQRRFEDNLPRHPGLGWPAVRERLEGRPAALKALAAMEASGGEPDVIGLDLDTGALRFCDCAVETPVGRRSLCYDDEALQARKDHPPKGSAVGLATTLGIELLTEADYRHLQTLGRFDLKTSSWIRTPAAIRALGGALFCDRRYDQVFVYHNGAQSYYAARGFRGLLRV